VTDITSAVLAAAQPASDGVPPLCTTPRGAGGAGLPASRVHAGSSKRPRPGAVLAAGIWPLASASVTKPGHTNIRNQHANMTRFYAEREGGSGPQPLRKQPA